MSKKNFSTKTGEWEEISVYEWEWIRWENPGTVIEGWLVDERNETVGGKEAKVFYFATEDGYVKFIGFKDLRKKLAEVKRRLKQRQKDWKEVKIRIEFEGTVERGNGEQKYKEKLFKVKIKTEKMKKEIEEAIPPLDEEEPDFEF
jgi:hypothetical protein